MRIVLALSFCIVATFGVAAEGPSGVRLQAFNGTNLDGWRVTGKAAIENGALVVPSGEGFVESDFPYSDFVLELKWRATKKAGEDAGIFFRARTSQAGNMPPGGYQISLSPGAEGNVASLPGANSSGLVKPDGWNELQLTVIGSKAALRINGRDAWQADGVASPSGIIAFKGAPPLAGQIAFRDIYITELGYKPLFNGVDLDGWQGVTSEALASWKVADGQIVCTGQRGTWLRSRAQVDDFNLRFAYKLRPGGNSGIYVRVPADGAHREGGGTEIQLLDDTAARYKDIEPAQFTGSVYKVAPASEHVARAAGQWNTMEINCLGTAYRIRHNGTLIIDANEGKYPELKERFRSGYLGLQNHSEEVWFRDLRLGPPQP